MKRVEGGSERLTVDLARQIAPYSLWVGHAGLVRDLRRVRNAGIVAVVDLAIDEPPLVVGRELIYCRFPLMDGAGNPRGLLRAAIDTVASLVRSGTPALVFCSAGMSRSPAIAAAGVSVVSGRPMEECLREVARTGPTDVSPALWSAVIAAAATSPPALI